MWYLVFADRANRRESERRLNSGEAETSATRDQRMNLNDDEYIYKSRDIISSKNLFRKAFKNRVKCIAGAAFLVSSRCFSSVGEEFRGARGKVDE